MTHTLPKYRPTRRAARLCTHAVTAAVALCLAACSPKADTAPAGAQSGGAGTGSGDGIIIVREKRHDYPEKFVAGVKELQSRCFEAKAVVAQAQGWAYDPATEQLSDADIAQLDTERIAEYFEGKRYAKLITGTRMDVSKLEPTREGSCKPLPVLFKSVEVHDGKCNVSRAHYDVSGKTGQRELQKDACTPPSKPPAQDGEPMAVPGTTAQCKWAPKLMVGGVALPTTPECTLTPSPIHQGTGRPLVAIRKAPDHLRASAAPLPGMQAMDMQSLVTTEHAVQISVGTSIPASTVELPADAASFPLAQ